MQSLQNRPFSQGLQHGKLDVTRRLIASFLRDQTSCNICIPRLTSYKKGLWIPFFRKGYQFWPRSKKKVQNLQTLHGYSLYILKHFATTLTYFTIFFHVLSSWGKIYFHCRNLPGSKCCLLRDGPLRTYVGY